MSSSVTMSFATMLEAISATESRDIIINVAYTALNYRMDSSAHSHAHAVHAPARLWQRVPVLTQQHWLAGQASLGRALARAC